MMARTNTDPCVADYRATLAQTRDILARMPPIDEDDEDTLPGDPGDMEPEPEEKQKHHG